MGEKEYLDAKERALHSLETACADHKVDDAILPLLTIINNIKGFYTSSSCAGRIVLLEIPHIGDKRQAKFLGVWHRPIEPTEIQTAASSATTGVLWLLAQAPILHIGVRTPELAETMIKTAISSGFKNSGIKSIGKKIVIEAASTERLDAPLGRDGVLLCDQNYLFLLVEIANEVIERSREKLRKFEKTLGKIPVFH